VWPSFELHSADPEYVGLIIFLCLHSMVGQFVFISNGRGIVDTP
jgi:hypothetical protein